MDCLFLDDLSEVTTTQCDDLMVDNSVWDMEINQNVIWYNKDGTPNYEANQFQDFKTMYLALNMNITYEANDGDLTLDIERTYIDCLSLKHCKNIQLAKKDYNQHKESVGLFDLTTNKLSPVQIAVLLFIAVLFGSIITEDLTEAMKEDALLNVISSSNQSMQITFHIIRLSLRIRQIVLPWFIGSATVSVLLTNSFSATNVVLNFLAVSFFVEADKMVVRLLLSEEQQSFVDRVIQQETSRVVIHEETVISSFIPRLFGLSMSIFVVVVVISFK